MGRAILRASSPEMVDTLRAALPPEHTIVETRPSDDGWTDLVIEGPHFAELPRVNITAMQFRDTDTGKTSTVCKWTFMHPDFPAEISWVIENADGS